jgi:hypothetical protein
MAMMRAVLQYLRYVLKHKYHVYLEGRKLGVGRWQLLVHDLSKFSRTEFFPYLVYFNRRETWENDPEKKREVKDRFDRAWLNHIHKNPHHWQHWVLRTDTEGVKVLEMPDKFVREMCADWEGVGACFGKPKGHAARWYVEHRATMAMHPVTRIRVEGVARCQCRRKAVQRTLHDPTEGMALHSQSRTRRTVRCHSARSTDSTTTYE